VADYFFSFLLDCADLLSVAPHFFLGPPFRLELVLEMIPAAGGCGRSPSCRAPFFLPSPSLFVALCLFFFPHQTRVMRCIRWTPLPPLSPALTFRRGGSFPYRSHIIPPFFFLMPFFGGKSAPVRSLGRRRRSFSATPGQELSTPPFRKRGAVSFF